MEWPDRNRKYCSAKCYYEDKINRPFKPRKERIIQQCLICGKTYKTIPSLVRKTCSFKCSRIFSGQRKRQSSGTQFKICPICKKTFTITQSRTKEGKGFYCSQTCLFEAKKTGQFWKTRKEMLEPLQEHCRRLQKLSVEKIKGKTYEERYGKEKAKKIKERMSISWNPDKHSYIPPPQFGNKHREGKSPYNKGLPKNKQPNWQGGLSFEPYGIEFDAKMKRQVRKRDDYSCQNCQKKQKKITFHVHHIDYDKKNNKPENLITLCPSCHISTNGNREYWENHFKFYINAVIVGGSANYEVTRQGSSTPQPSLHISNKEDIWRKFKLGEQV